MSEAVAMWTRWIWTIGFCALLLMVGSTGDAQAQERRWSDEVWTPIIKHEGVRFSYIFYSEADNVNNGVVVRLDNRNDYPVRYRFTVVFRTWDGAEQTGEAAGRLTPGEMRTGENDGLFWIPFKDGRSIGEVGLRGYHIERVRPE